MHTFERFFILMLAFNGLKETEAESMNLQDQRLSRILQSNYYICRGYFGIEANSTSREAVRMFAEEFDLQIVTKRLLPTSSERKVFYETGMHQGDDAEAWFFVKSKSKGRTYEYAESKDVISEYMDLSF